MDLTNSKMPPEKNSYTAETGNGKRHFFEKHQNNMAMRVDYFILKKIFVYNFSFLNVKKKKMHFCLAAGGQRNVQLRKQVFFYVLLKGHVKCKF